MASVANVVNVPMSWFQPTTPEYKFLYSDSNDGIADLEEYERAKRGQEACGEDGTESCLSCMSTEEYESERETYLEIAESIRRTIWDLERNAEHYDMDNGVGFVNIETKKKKGQLLAAKKHFLCHLKLPQVCGPRSVSSFNDDQLSCITRRTEIPAEKEIKNIKRNAARIGPATRPKQTQGYKQAEKMDRASQVKKEERRRQSIDNRRKNVIEPWVKRGDIRDHDWEDRENYNLVKNEFGLTKANKIVKKRRGGRRRTAKRWRM
jgi:hypothetical protein